MARPLEHGRAADGKSARGILRYFAGGTVKGEGVPLAFALSVCGGAGIYLQLPFEPGVGLSCLSFLGAIMLVLFVTRRPVSVGVRTLGLLLFAFALGFGAGKLRVSLNASTVQTGEIGPVLIEGWVQNIESGRKGQRLRLQVHAIGGLSQDETPQTVRLTHRLDLRVSSGRFVRCWGHLRPPPGRAVPGDYDFERQAWFEGLDAVGYVLGRCRGGVLGPPQGGMASARLQVAAYRRQLARFTFDKAGQRAGGFAAALVSGDRSYMSSEDQDALRGAGLAHLLAISGLHLGIVGGLIYLMTRRGLGLISPLARRYPVQKPAAVCAILAITAYLVLSGASVSTQRAYVMSLVFFTAILFDRPALSLRSFSLAMLAVVLLRPESVFSPGFQMSFAATGVLIAIYSSWTRTSARHYQSGSMGRLWFGFKSLSVTSIAASIATAPFAIYHFERIAPLGLIANLLAMPVVSILAVPAAGLAILLTPFGRADWGISAFGLALEPVLEIAHWADRVGDRTPITVGEMPPLALLGFSVVLIGFVLFRRWLRWGVVGLGVVGAVVIWSLAPRPQGYWAHSGDVYLRLANETGYTKIAVKDIDRLGPLGLSDTAPERLCNAARCAYNVAGGGEIIILERALRLSDCRTDGPSQLFLIADERRPDHDARSAEAFKAHCPQALYWSDIEARGGARFSQIDQSPQIEFVNRCTPRPWRNCE